MKYNCSSLAKKVFAELGVSHVFQCPICGYSGRFLIGTDGATPPAIAAALMSVTAFNSVC